MFVDADVEISEPIQPDITGVSSAVPSFQIEATTEKVLYLILLVHSIINWSDPSNQDFLAYVGTQPSSSELLFRPWEIYWWGWGQFVSHFF